MGGFAIDEMKIQVFTQPRIIKIGMLCYDQSYIPKHNQHYFHKKECTKLK